VRLKLLIYLLVMPLITHGQLTGPGSSMTRSTAYPSGGQPDQIFVFCVTNTSQRGAIQAMSPGGTGPFTFTWNQWNGVSKAFDLFIKTEVNPVSSIASNLNEGGYRVRITDGGGYDTTLTGWVFLNKPIAEASLLDFKCDYVALRGKAQPEIFVYADPVTGNNVNLPGSVSFLWSSTPVSAIPFPSSYTNPALFETNPVTFSPPLVDVTYKLTVTDNNTCQSDSSFFYTSIHVQGAFSVDPIEGEAPLEVTVTDNSVRALKYVWQFGDDSTSTLANPAPHTYFKPGEYTIRLFVESDLFCTDSADIRKVTVLPSLLDVPNVFTPDGDNINDYFMVDARSLRFLQIQIFSRSGKKVYEFTGNSAQIKEWRGWDGSINGTSAKASPGVYMYLIQALGWDDKEYEGRTYRGVVHLYR